MNRSASINKLLLILPFMVLLGIACLSLFLPKILLYNHMALAISLDLVVTVPLLYIISLWRNPAIPRITFLSMFIVCLVVGHIIIPEEHRSALNLVKSYGMPLIELGIFIIVIYQTRSLILEYRKFQKNIDFAEAIKIACQKVLPARAASVFASELTTIYYLLPWRRYPIANTGYSYHRRSGITSVLWALIGLVIVETFVMHLLLERWNVMIAWIVTGMSVYACLQIISQMRAMSHRKILINLENQTLNLRNGYFTECIIPLASITRIEKNRRTLPTDGSTVALSPFSILDSHNLIIYTSDFQVISGLYGFKKEATAIAFYVDDREKFTAEIDQYIPK